MKNKIAKQDGKQERNLKYSDCFIEERQDKLIGNY